MGRIEVNTEQKMVDIRLQLTIQKRIVLSTTEDGKYVLYYTTR